MDEAGQIIFEQALAVGRKEGDDLLVVGRVGAGQTEKHLLTLLIEGHGLEAEGDGPILDIGKGLRVMDFEAQLAFRRCDIFGKQFAHALRIDAI